MPQGKRTSAGHHNRRAFPRWQASVELRLVRGKSVIAVAAEEISEGGLSFRSPEALAVEDILDLEFRLDGSEGWTRVRCAVRHISGDRVGVEFLTLKRADRLRIVDLLAASA